MNLTDAKATLKKMAKGEYHSAEQRVNEHSDGTVTKVYGVYIDGYPWSMETSWLKAFDGLRGQIINNNLTKEN